MSHVRHGDILLRPVTEIPEGIIVDHNGSFVLAEGEMTGHRHVLTAAKENMQIVKVGNTFYVSLTIPSPVKHEEHGLVEVPAGLYRIEQEQEYNYFLNEIVRVQD